MLKIQYYYKNKNYNGDSIIEIYASLKKQHFQIKFFNNDSNSIELLLPENLLQYKNSLSNYFKEFFDMNIEKFNKNGGFMDKDSDRLKIHGQGFLKPKLNNNL